ncbi:putative protein EMBRYONIC FLOWER 1 [Lupinus albus]|uniref:Uncharacterized protein n=1 Tax=Lupinus albus TaxID=3870 RepID=A0A6A4PFV7_LUPAL|nr:putative protein EMBRYONIC FLOWER 1 [Lupinus albus]
MRKADWRKCWSFPTNMSKEEQSSPPMNVTKFKWWTCENCLNETTTEGTNDISSAIEQAPIVPDDNLVRRGLDLNLPIDLSNDNDDLPIDFETGLENNLNSQVSSIPPPEVSPHIEEEVQPKESDVEPPATSLINEHPMRHLPQDSTVFSDAVPTNSTHNVVNDDIMDHQLSKSPSLSEKGHQKKSLVSNSLSENQEQGFNQPTEVHESASHPPPTNMFADSQTPPVLSDKVDVEEDMHAKKRGRESDEVNDVEALASNLNNDEHEEGHLPLDSNVSSHVVPTGNTENIAENDDLDHNPTDSTNSSSCKPPKMRLISDLLALEPQPPTNVATNPDSLPNLPEDGADVQEGTSSRKRGRGRKRKRASNKKESKRPTRNENEVQNLEGDDKTIDTIPHNELEEFCNKDSTRQTNRWLCLQEVTANPHLLLKDSETTIFGASSSHNADVNCGKGKEVLIEEINRAEKEAETVGAGTMTENSNQGATDDIPMEFIELLKNMQYEKTLDDVGNVTNLFEQPTQKESGIIIREENALPENNGKSINIEKKGKRMKEKSKNLDQPNSNANINLQKRGKKTDVGTSRRKNAKRMKDKSNDSTTPVDAVAAAEMLQSAFDSSHCSKKLKIGPSKSGKNVKKFEKGECSKSTKQKEASNNLPPWWFNRKINLKDMANRMNNVHRAQETSWPFNTVYENVCMVNNNHVDQNVSEERTASRFNGEDMTLEDNVPEERNDLPAPGGNNSKKNMKGKKK